MDHFRRGHTRDRLRRSGAKRDAWSGQSVAEFALIVPLALLVMGAALDMGRLFYVQVSLENAAREGAFYGAVNPRCDTAGRTLCADPDTAEWRVRNEAVGLDALNVTFSCSSGGTPVSMTSCQAGDMYETSVSTTFNLVTPLLAPVLGNDLNLDASATAVVLDDAFDPSASPQPQASLPPLCMVPDMVGSDVAVAEDSWAAAGFVKQNYDYAPMKRSDIVAAQTIPAGWTEPCDTAVITVSQ